MKTLHKCNALIYFCFLHVFAEVKKGSLCAHINEVFQQSAQMNDLSQSACQCFTDSTTSYESKVEQSLEIWVGCSRQRMPHVFNALNALNESLVSKLWIWDSFINIVPAKMFPQIRPRTLSIQRSGLSVFRPNAFNKVGQILKVLELRQNLLKELDPSVFRQLNHLSVLDLAGNKISRILKGQLDALSELKVFVISDNHLIDIEDGAFQKMKKLRILNLANNRLCNITCNMFRGLDNLEELYLQGNNFVNLDWRGFELLKKLKIMNLGSNQLGVIALNGLINLEKLILNNNSLKSLKNIVLKNLCNLQVLIVDRNFITEILEDDLNSLKECTRLKSLSLAFNQLRTVEWKGFEPVSDLQTLSLQNNHLKSISSVPFGGTTSFMQPLAKLQQLYLSYNDLAEVSEKDFSGFLSLKLLELDNNRIEKIGNNAFRDLPLTHLYLSNNRLSYIPTGIFDTISKDIKAIDLSGNSWQCTCGQDWLPKWLAKMGSRVTHRYLMGCVTLSDCSGEETLEFHSPMIAVIASILGSISILILFAIALLYFENGRHMRRTSSDLLHLISNTDETEKPLYEARNQIEFASKISGKKRVRFDGI